MNKKGVTLIELLIALVISAVLVAGIYRVFISTQRSYTVQDQVVEMQQNVRAAINKMMREIRMMNFGRVVSFDEPSDSFISNVLPVNGFATVLTANPDNITIVGGFEQIKNAAGNPITVVYFTSSPPTITLSSPTSEFNGAANGYLSIGGEESFIVKNQPVGSTDVLTLDRAPNNPVRHFVFKVQVIRYCVDNDQVFRRAQNPNPLNPVCGGQPVADNIESLQFQYFNASGAQTLIPNSTTSIQVTITARTKDPDPTYGSDGGFRRRQIVSSIQLRNMGRGMGVP